MKVELLYLLPTVIAFAWFIIINLKKNALSVHRWSSLFILSLGALFFFDQFYYDPKLKYSMWVDIGFDVAISFIVALNYLTMRDLTGVRGVRKRDCLIFLYPLAAFTFLYYFCVKASPTEIVYYMEAMRMENSAVEWTPLVNYAVWFNFVFCVIAIIALIVTCRWSIKRTKWYIQMLEEYYVNIRRKAGYRVRALIALNVTTIIIVTYLIAVPLSWKFPVWSGVLVSIIFSAYTFFAGWTFNRIYYSTCELKRKLLKDTPEGGIDAIVSELHIAMGRRPEPDHPELLPEKVFSRIYEEGIYLLYHCTLRRVSTRLEVPRHMLTRSIHHYSGLTFSAYIRSLRMAKAVELLESIKGHNAMTVEEISTACGYSDPLVFSQDLADTTGMTPQMYLGEALSE